MKYRVTIGMEFHVQCNTRTKLFSCAPLQVNCIPNVNVALVDAGMPGALPAVNQEAIRKAIKTALALKMKVSPIISFDRKHYLYPDLPLGYQITQMTRPIGIGGVIETKSGPVQLSRLALEADAGKSTHIGPTSHIDLNRCGAPLMEIITEPDMHSVEQACAVFEYIQILVRYLDTSDANMEQGQLRADVNISISKSDELGTRVEVKNINSINFAKQAIEYEIQRQAQLLDNGQEVIMETRGFDSATGETYLMRSKENAADYRYIPEHDISAIRIDSATIDSITAELPELFNAKVARYSSHVSEEIAVIIAHDYETAKFFDQCYVLSLTHDPSVASLIIKTAANLLLADFTALIKQDKIHYHESKITPAFLYKLASLIQAKRISSKQAKDVLKIMYQTGQDPEVIIQEHGLLLITDKMQIQQIVEQVLVANPRQVEQYHAGNHKLFGFFVGNVLKASNDQADPEIVHELTQQALSQ